MGRQDWRAWFGNQRDLMSVCIFIKRMCRHILHLCALHARRKSFTIMARCSDTGFLKSPPMVVRRTPNRCMSAFSCFFLKTSAKCSLFVVALSSLSNMPSHQLLLSSQD
jgi:hypothetical protein